MQLMSQFGQVHLYGLMRIVEWSLGVSVDERASRRICTALVIINPTYRWAVGLI